jgi:hypothetical protein
MRLSFLRRLLFLDAILLHEEINATLLRDDKKVGGLFISTNLLLKLAPNFWLDNF